MTFSAPINLLSSRVTPDGVGPAPAAREEISA
jgi:hypothetical protein